jgi:hypothetical protein
MAGLGRVNIKSKTDLAVAAGHLLLLAFTPGVALAEQPSRLVPPQATTDVVAQSKSTYFPDELMSLVPELPSLTSFDSISEGFATVAASTDELVNTLGQGLGNWEEIALKTVTYETLSAGLEAGLFVTYFGGSLATAGSVFVVALAGSSIIYVANEYAWDYFSSPHISSTAPERIAAKAATYRSLSILRTFAVGNIFGGLGEVSRSTAFTLSVTVLDSALYGIVEYSFETMFEEQKNLAPGSTPALLVVQAAGGHVPERNMPPAPATSPRVSPGAAM